jgi:1,4-alpha-glucan branching enzyme
MSDILSRRETHFVLWCPAATNPPKLVIGQIKNGNPATFEPLTSMPMASSIEGLWELRAEACGLRNGQTYHYWFEVDNSLAPGSSIKVTDPLAYGVDYRLLPKDDTEFERPAAVISWVDGRLVVCDPNGENCQPLVGPFEKLKGNNQLVIYELPTAWVRTSGGNEYERAVGTFRDIHAMLEKDVSGANFPHLSVTAPDRQYFVELGVNAIEFLPPADSIYSREWGYGTSHYCAPDYELGYPEGHLSPTSNQDLTALITACHKQGIRIFLDVVLGFMKNEPYRNIDFNSFYLENPKDHLYDEDAYSSRYEGGKKKPRDPFGASCPRYVRKKKTYDPMTGSVKEISPARQHMLTFLSRWMRDFQIDGIRMDSVENVANWDFIRDFKDEARKQFRDRYPEVNPDEVDSRFLVVGEELHMPMELLQQNRLDGLWNEKFQTLVRAAILGENAGHLGEQSFEWTVRKAIDCREIGFRDGAQAINYLTSHDVQGERKERLYNLMRHVINRGNSQHLFDEAEIIHRISQNTGKPTSDGEVKHKANQEIESILHAERLRRIKLAFVCLLTSVGVPMILAGEEFGDQHDLFDAGGNVTHEGGKQVDPVNYSRLTDGERVIVDRRRKLFEYVSRLVKLRTDHHALSVNDTEFIHVDFNEGKRVLVWKRGTTDPVVVVANFSDYTTPFAPAPGTEYFVPNWPQTPAGHHWFEVTQNRHITNGQHNRESIFAWEAKVYKLEP